MSWQEPLSTSGPMHTPLFDGLMCILIVLQDQYDYMYLLQTDGSYEN